MAVLMAVHGRFAESFSPVVGRISLTANVAFPADTVLVCRDGACPDNAGFGAVLVQGNAHAPISGRIGVFDDLGHLESGDLVLVDGRNGRVRTLYRKASPHNALFVTERCNNNCLMCSQPPRIDGEEHLDMCLRVLDLLEPDPPARLGITGGEPTLLGKGFLRLLEAIKAILPDTTITALTNGRAFADPVFVDAVASVAHPKLRFTIPLHGDVSDVHDHIAQAHGAFEETIAGFYNLAAKGIESEIRVVLHARSTPRLLALAEFIYRKLPFVQQVAFMGMENMGYVKKNWHELWIDPLDYAAGLEAAVSCLYRRDIGVSIYNLPLCVLPEPLWDFARQSISDHKNILIDDCAGCTVASHCAGFFSSGQDHHSRGIHPIVSPRHAAEGECGGEG